MAIALGSLFYPSRAVKHRALAPFFDVHLVVSRVLMHRVATKGHGSAATLFIAVMPRGENPLALTEKIKKDVKRLKPIF